MSTRYGFILVFFALIGLSATCIWLGRIDRAEDSLIQRRYAEAVTHLEAALREEPEQNRDRGVAARTAHVTKPPCVVGLQSRDKIVAKIEEHL